MKRPATSSSAVYPAHARPFLGIVNNTVEALQLVHAAHLGVIPRIIRRLNDEERREMIKSGAVFVFDVAEADMKRWTDGRLWSTSRIDGNFLIYKEKNARILGEVIHDRFEEWKPGPDSGVTVSRAGAHDHRLPGPYSDIERPSSSGGIKVGGLLKKTITVKINNCENHLIAYYTEEDVTRKMMGISDRPDIMGVHLSPDIFRFSNFRLQPRLEKRVGMKPRVICEPETREYLLDLSGPPQYTARHPSEHLDFVQNDASTTSWSSNSNGPFMSQLDPGVFPTADIGSGQQRAQLNATASIADNDPEQRYWMSSFMEPAVGGNGQGCGDMNFETSERYKPEPEYSSLYPVPPVPLPSDTYLGPRLSGLVMSTSDELQRTSYDEGARHDDRQPDWLRGQTEFFAPPYSQLSHVHYAGAYGGTCALSDVAQPPLPLRPSEGPNPRAFLPSSELYEVGPRSGYRFDQSKDI